MDESRIDALEERVKSLEKENRLLFRWAWICVMGLNFFTACRVIYIFTMSLEASRKMYFEMLAGEPIPFETQLCFAFWQVPVAFAVLVVIGLGVLGLLGSRKGLVPMISVGIVTWFILLLLAGIGTTARFAPFLRLIERLG